MNNLEKLIKDKEQVCLKHGCSKTSLYLLNLEAGSDKVKYALLLDCVIDDYRKIK